MSKLTVSRVPLCWLLMACRSFYLLDGHLVIDHCAFITPSISAHHLASILPGK